jgi:hypothetical protein
MGGHAQRSNPSAARGTARSAVRGEEIVLGLCFQAVRFHGELAGVQGAHLVTGYVKGGVAVLEAGNPTADLTELEARPRATG